MEILWLYRVNNSSLKPQFQEYWEKKTVKKNGPKTKENENSLLLGELQYGNERSFKINNTFSLGIVAHFHFYWDIYSHADRMQSSIVNN